MLNFRCECGNTLYFENTRCVRCEKELGFAPSHLALSALEPNDAGQVAVQLPDKPLFRFCKNYSSHHVCNWLVPADDSDEYCLSCRFTSVIPNLEIAGNTEKWASIEAAKRRLFFTLLRLKLPLQTKAQDAERGLDFQLREDPPGPWTPEPHVLTGHAHGVITLNIVEADDAAREQARVAMHEPYRTLLGHLRHEIGHYYWRLLVDWTQYWPQFHALFGDSDIDYAAALQTYHHSGPPPDWTQRFVSAYASSHPWEDWAESWAHYLHIYDTVETANDLGLTGKALPLKAGASEEKAPFEQMISTWESLSVALNCLNRSLGQRDAYPFVIAKPVVEKFAFIHKLIAETGAAEPAAPITATSSPHPEAGTRDPRRICSPPP